MSVYILLYQSQAARPLKIRDVLAIYGAAQRKNPDRSITGLLTYAESDPYAPEPEPDRFMQWLEGPEDEVKALFQHICADSRHERIQVLAEGPAAAHHGHDVRLFPQWAMGINLSDGLPDSLKTFFAFLADNNIELNYRPALSHDPEPTPPSPPRSTEATGRR